MIQSPRKIAILGSTGSIGCNTLDVVAAAESRFEVTGLSGHSRLDDLQQQATHVHPQWLAATDPEAASQFAWDNLPSGVEVIVGMDGLERAVAEDDSQIVVAAIVGAAGLRGTWAALEAGKTVALANKETLVTAGPLVTRLAAERGAEILPVDSEHSAVFQALQSGRRDQVRRVILTASGGPFRGWSSQQLHEATPEQALAHPTWDMGPKISIDSANMMNKALEIIEARWLFDLAADQIDVVVHPQSIVHSLVEFNDGSVIAQLSPPDMRLPIQYALSYPDRWPGPADRLDLSEALNLEFQPPDWDQFPALGLGKEVAAEGGTCGAVLNAANEAAVELFLQRQIRFTDIASVCREILNQHHFETNPTLERLLQLDNWARKEVNRWTVC